MQGEIEHFPCDSKMTMFIPTSKYVKRGIKKAVVILQNPHTHLLSSAPRLTITEREIVRNAIKSAGVRGMTAKKLVRGTHQTHPAISPDQNSRHGYCSTHYESHIQRETT